MMTPLLLLFTDRFGTEAYGWDPQSIEEAIKDEWTAVPHQNAFDRLMCGISIQSGDDFFQETPTFVEFCNLLSGGILDPRVFDPATTAECAWGLLEVSLNDPPDDGTLRQRLSDDVIGYIQGVAKYEGFSQVPEILKDIVQPAALDVDDPDLYQAVWQTQSEKKQEIEDWLQGRLQTMGIQLSGIHLTDGKNEYIQKLAERFR